MNRRRNYGAMAGLLGLLIVIAIIAFLMVGKFGKGGKSYVERTIDTKKQAQSVVAAANLASIYRSLQTYAMGYDGKYPASAKEFAYAISLPNRYLKRPDKPDMPYVMVYVPGQDENSPRSNVLLYEEEPQPDGTHQVLLASGKTGVLSTDELNAALEATALSIK